MNLTAKKTPIAERLTWKVLIPALEEAAWMGVRGDVITKLSPNKRAIRSVGEAIYNKTPDEDK